MRILLLDIENSFNVGALWQARNDYVSHKMLLKDRELMCFAAKWYQEDYTYWYRGKNMLRKAIDMLDAADVLVTFNGKKHDWPILNQEMAKARMAPPSPFFHVDLCQVGKQEFNLYSNSLDYTLRYFGLPGKTESGGMETWFDCMNPRSMNHRQAWADMEAYNRNDVIVMEPLYDLYKPRIRSSPNLNLYNELEDCCPTCGSDDYHSRGYRYTSIARYRRFQCNGCGRWFSSGKRDRGVDLR